MTPAPADTIASYASAAQEDRVVVDLGHEGCQVILDHSDDGVRPDPVGARRLGERIADPVRAMLGG